MYLNSPLISCSSEFTGLLWGHLTLLAQPLDSVGRAFHPALCCCWHLGTRSVVRRNGWTQSERDFPTQMALWWTQEPGLSSTYPALLLVLAPHLGQPLLLQEKLCTGGIQVTKLEHRDGISDYPPTQQPCSGQHGCHSQQSCSLHTVSTPDFYFK